MPQQAEHRLAAGSAWQGPVKHDGEDIDLVFTDEAGRLFSTSRLRRSIAALGKRAGIEGSMHPHRLRHAYASLGLAAVDRGETTLTAIAEHLGHKDATITQAIYGHSLKDDRRSAGSVVSSAIGGAT